MRQFHCVIHLGSVLCRVKLHIYAKDWSMFEEFGCMDNVLYPENVVLGTFVWTQFKGLVCSHRTYRSRRQA